jgi:hypothetical protein
MLTQVLVVLLTMQMKIYYFKLDHDRFLSHDLLFSTRLTLPFSKLQRDISQW